MYWCVWYMWVWGVGYESECGCGYGCECVQFMCAVHNHTFTTFEAHHFYLLLRSQNELGSYQKKVFVVDKFMGIGISVRLHST